MESVPPPVSSPPSISLLSSLDDVVTPSLFSEDQLAAVCLDYLSSLFGVCQELEPGALLPTPPGAAPAASSCSTINSGVMMCLASVLEALAECDERCVFSVRKINKLGFKSYSALRKYFSQFGSVSAIYFLPYRYKPDTSSVRPSSMAFIRMSSRQAVDAVFSSGSLHYINGWPVTVQPFTRSPHAFNYPV